MSGSDIVFRGTVHQDQDANLKITFPLNGTTLEIGEEEQRSVASSYATSGADPRPKMRLPGVFNINIEVFCPSDVEQCCLRGSMSGTSAFASVLRARYAMPGTDLGYAATSLPQSRALDAVSRAVLVRSSYALPVLCPTHSLCDVRHSHTTYLLCHVRHSLPMHALCGVRCSHAQDSRCRGCISYSVSVHFIPVLRCLAIIEGGGLKHQVSRECGRSVADWPVCLPARGATARNQTQETTICVQTEQRPRFLVV
eukprot:1639082-Rhodomonas_salina.5